MAPAMISAQKTSCLAVELKVLLASVPMIPQIGGVCRFQIAGDPLLPYARASAFLRCGRRSFVCLAFRYYAGLTGPVLRRCALCGPGTNCSNPLFREIFEPPGNSIVRPPRLP